MYDNFNQLIEAEGEHSVYDALGRRIQRGSQSFLYVGEDEIGVFEQGRAVELQIPGYTKAVGIEIQGHAYLPIHDVQGTVRSLVDWKTGEISQRNQCDVFGVGLNPAIPYAYAGKRYDPQTGLIYFGKRYYDPNLGRWLTTDPIGPSDHANLYQYVYNNPFQYGDPSGMFAVPLVGMAFGAGLSLTPVGWAVLGVAAVSYATVWSVQKMTENGAIKPDYAPAITSLVGGFTGSMVNTIPQPRWNISTGSAYGASPYMSEFGYIPEQSYGHPSSIWKNINVYAPDRPLPNNADGVHVPDTDAPHTQLGTKGSKRRPGETYPQAREFDGNGKPVLDIDFTDHGKPSIHPKPHQHRHEENPTGGSPRRGDPRPLENWSY